MADIDIIKSIERILPIKLHQREKLESGNRGYTINTNGSIRGINLHSLIIQLESLVALLKKLTAIEALYLPQNQISDITSLCELTNLKILYLNENQIIDIGPIKGLVNLRELYLSNNQINNLSPLKDLKNLSTLSLSSNQISDISPLKDLNNLTSLNLYNNRIVELRPWITDFKMEIGKSTEFSSGNISLDRNPIKTPPLEIVEQGKDAIRNYFTQLAEQSEDYLFEAKMLIVGEPGAGKTSLAWKMEDPNCHLPRENETTKGIEVKQYYFPLHKEDFSTFKFPGKLVNKNFRLNLWDFGGQEIYKATHRFFLSKRSLYALVADSRNEDTDFNYWLHIVEMFGGESPLLIILNEKFHRKRLIDIADMRNRFTNIVEVITVDLAENENTRLNQLRKAIEYHVSKLAHIGSPVPAKWKVIREMLEHESRNTISLQEYLLICDRNGIKKTQDALVLSQYFHDIGVFLHFQDEELLNQTIFLNPTWATHAVYQILDHPLLNQKNGRFRKSDAIQIWHEGEYTMVRNELLHLMKKFLLTYEIGNSGEYIVPERLPASQPEYEWDEKNNLILQYKYDFFMPKGILSQFIVQMNRYAIDQQLVWKRGIILAREGAKAEVIESYDARTIKIRITGSNRRDFMTLVTERLDELNLQYEKMRVEKLIPCNCDDCKSDGKPYFYEYQDLKRRIEKGRREIECGRSYQLVNVRSLIDEVLNEDMLMARKLPPEKLMRNKIFVSYSHKDIDWLLKLQTHLKVLENIGISVNAWDDTKIKAGTKWREQIEKALSTAKIAILLVSTDFLASEFISKDELPPLLKAAEKDGATILPIILKPCLFAQHSKLSEFQAVNNPSKPLSSLTESEQDQAFVNLANRIIELNKIE